MVTRGSRLADVGTDHGWVPIYLVQTGHIPSALAMDIGRGPLARAQEHIRQHGMEARIECRLSDGLEGYARGECDSILIAGMGGELIISILERGREKLTDGMQLVLSPHTHVELVREYLDRCGYALTDEICIYDEGKYYFLLDVQVREQTQVQAHVQSQTKADMYMISRLLTEKQDPVYRSYLTDQIAKYKYLIEKDGIGEVRIRELRELIVMYRMAEACYS